MSPIETALREANEEVGLRSDDVNVLGNLDVYITGTGFRIMPIVSIVSDYSYLKANQNEVDEIFFLPLEFLMDSNNHKKESATYEVNNKKYEINEKTKIDENNNDDVFETILTYNMNKIEIAKA